MTTASAYASCALHRRPLPAPRAACARALRSAVQRCVVLPVVGAICHPEIEGQRQLAHVDGPCVVVANHQSHLDLPVLLAALPAAMRRRAVVPAAADYWFTHPGRAIAARALADVSPLPRGGGGGATLGACQDALRDGGVVLIFPEGTRTRDGLLGRFHRGAALLAMRARVPVVPVGISGLREVLPAGASLPHPGRCAVCVGEPLVAAPAETAERFTARIEARVRALRDAAAAAAAEG
jgi:1-acyl-sn-glycerol-3-phosphate acyltransferase